MNPFTFITDSFRKVISSGSSSFLFPSGFYTPSDIDYIRMARTQEYWRLYCNEDYLKHFKLQGEKDREKLFSINYGKLLINTVIMFTVGEPFAISAPEGREGVSLLCDMVWEANNKRVKGFNIFQSGSVSGDCFIKVGFDDNAKNKEFLEKIRIVVIPSNYVFPVWDAENPDRMLRCEIHTLLPRDKAKFPYNEKGKYKHVLDPNFMRHIEYITETEIREYIDYEEIVEKQRENILKEVPVVHIPNFKVNERYWGVSDYVDFVDLQDLINELDTSTRNIVKYHEQPTTIVYGAKARQLEKGFNKIWSGLPANAKVENLVLETDLSNTNKFKERLREEMYAQANVPELVRGKNIPISNTSGVALEMMYFPSVVKSKVKQSHYAPGLSLINYFILRYLQTKKENFKLENYIKQSSIEKEGDFEKSSTEEKIAMEFKRNIYHTDIIYKSILPKDEQKQLDTLAKKLEMKIITREKVLSELGEKNITDTLERVDAEQIKLNSLVVAENEKTIERIMEDILSKKGGN